MEGLSAWDQGISFIDDTLAGYGVQPARMENSVGMTTASSTATQTKKKIAGEDCPDAASHEVEDDGSDLHELQRMIQHLEQRRELANAKVNELRQRTLENAEKIYRSRDLAVAAGTSTNSPIEDQALSSLDLDTSMDFLHTTYSAESSASSQSGSPRQAFAHDSSALSGEGKSLSVSRVAALRLATARHDDLDIFTDAFWKKYPKAVQMLEDVLEVWTGKKGDAGAQIAGHRSRECACAFDSGADNEVVPGGPCDERDTLWARVLFGQEAKIRWLLKDNAMRRQQLALQERLPEMDACPVVQREMRSLHGDSTAQQDLICQLLAASPSFPSTCSEQESQIEHERRGPDCRPSSSPYHSPRSNHDLRNDRQQRTPGSTYESPNHSVMPDCDSQARSDALAGLRRAFFRSGLTVRTPEALSELAKLDPADVVGALLEDVWRLRRQCRARHSAAVEAVQQARLNGARARCEKLVDENAKLLGSAKEVEERQQAFLQDRNRYTDSVALRMRAPTTRSSGPSKICNSLGRSSNRQMHNASQADVTTAKGWIPAGKTNQSHCHHALHVSKQSLGQGCPAAHPEATSYQRSLAPWWVSRVARRIGSVPTTGGQSLWAGSALSDERFDANSLYRSSISATAERHVIAGGSSRRPDSLYN
mmetsp:Transcript_96539/g.152727  ORF Transcript_96539/g.152727 Transcript_96539/m.152727 type:complete len:651 (+) Transcript_96539:106-2058(+)